MQYGLPVPGGCGERALRPSWRSSGVGKPHSLCPRNWLAAQPGRCPWLTPESPSSGGLLGILVGLTLNTKHWALLFLPGAQSAAGGGCCLSQCNPNLSVRRVQYLLFWVGEKWKTTFGFSVTLVRGSRKALSFPNLNHLTKDIAGPSGQPGYPPAIDPSAPTPKIPSPLHPPFPGFLNYSILTQRCYLPNTLPTHSCLSCLLLFNSPAPSCFSQTLFPVLIALKGTRGPTDPGAYILACGVKQSCESLKISLLRVANRSCLFRSSLMVSCLIFSLFFSTFTLKTKCPELDC